MEESSNGRLEETLKVQAHDEEKEVVLEDSEVSKPDVEVVRGIIADGNSRSVNEMPDGEDSSSSSSRSSDKEAEPEERSPHVENSETFEEEIVISDSVELELGVSLTEEFSQDIEPSVEKSGDSDVAELDAKETEKNISPSLDDTNADPPILTDLLITGLKKETEQLSSAETTRDSAFLTDVELKGTDNETTLPGLDETNGSTVAADVISRGIEETTISFLAGNGGVPAAAVAQGIAETKIPASDNNAGGSSGFPELAAKENVEDSLQAANVPIVETRDAGELVNKPEIHESTANQPIISLSHRPVQPTSWKSCCGLFEVLRRSDR